MKPSLDPIRDRRRRRLSLGFFVAYALASLLSSGYHDHRDTAGQVPRPQSGCEDRGLHLAGHRDAPDLSHDADQCATCHWRLQQHAPWSDSLILAVADGGPTLSLSPTPQSVRAPRHITCRAPPCV